MSRNPSAVVIECLESRQLFSSAGIIRPLMVFSPSEVQGTYKGGVTLKVLGIKTKDAVTLTITSTKARANVAGFGDYSVRLTAKAWNKLRHGTLNITKTLSGETIHMVLTVSESGAKMDGTFQGTGLIKSSGTVSLRKST